MTDYLARLKARTGQEHVPDEPPELTKPSFVGFDSDLGGHSSQATNGAAGVPASPSSAGMAPPDTGAPRAWAEGFARLDPARPPYDVPQPRWLRFIDDRGQFLDHGWAAKAAALGWGAADLFGCDRHRPWARIDQAGLLWLVAGRRLLALTAESATIEAPSGGWQTYRRMPNGPDQVLAWSLSAGDHR
jgi:hypothetical protein